MRMSVPVIISLLLAAPCAAQETSTPTAKDSVSELAGALMRSGAISQPDWWKIVQLRGAELNAPAKEEKIQPPAVPQPPTPQPPAAQLSRAPQVPDGVTLKIGALTQFRYTWADAAPGKTNSSAFAVKTARIKFSGDLPHNFRYSLQLAFERVNTTSTADAALYDLALTWAPRPDLALTFGQIVMPFGAETTSPTDKLDFVSRYYAQDRILNPSGNHDTGAMVSGKAAGGRLQYYAGMFNGKGANYCDNDNEKFLYAGRLVWAPGKWRLLGHDAELALGASALGDSTRGDPSALRSDAGAAAFTRAYGRYAWGGDLGLRAGPAWVKGEYISALLDGQGGDPEVRAYGWHASAGYGLLRGKLELLGRYQVYDPNTAHVTSKDIRWTTLGFNWFVDGHREKVQVNYTFKRERASSVPNDELAAQLQLAF